MATATTPTPGAVTLSVEFAGLCLYVIRRKTEPKAGEDPPPATEVTVLMPNCVPTNGNTTLEDGDIGARHVPYLLVSRGQLEPDAETRNPPGFVADGSRFQVVRRLGREQLRITLEGSQESVTLRPTTLPLPDLSVYKDKIELKSGWDSDLTQLGPEGLPELSVRTILHGGTLTATTLDGSGARPNGALGQKNAKWHATPEDWAGFIEWTGIVPEPLEIGIRSWATGQEHPLTLWPVTVEGKKVIKLKIANLCETNPLEWWQFEHRMQTNDVDFKWLYRLFDPINRTNNRRLLDEIGVPDPKRARNELPYPKLTNRRARTSGSTGCTGGQFGLP